MNKTKPDEALSGRSIAKRIVAKMKLQGQRKVVNIKNVIAGHAMTEGLQKTVVSRKELDPGRDTSCLVPPGQIRTGAH